MSDENVNQTPEEEIAPEVEPIETPEPVSVPQPPVAPEPPMAPEAAAAPEPPAAPVPPAASYMPPPPPAAAPAGSSDKNKVVAGVLAILLGSLGIHKFYLGYNKEGLILLLVTVLTMGTLAWVTSVIGIIEGVIYLTKTDEDFYGTYVAGRKAWF